MLLLVLGSILRQVMQCADIQTGLHAFASAIKQWLGTAACIASNLLSALRPTLYQVGSDSCNSCNSG